MDDWLFMFPFFFASPIAMELLKVYFRSRTANVMDTGQAPVSGTPVASLAQQGPANVPVARVATGGKAMIKVLIPVDGSRNCEFAVRHVIKQFMNNTAMEIHLLNVQPSFSAYIARFVSRKTLHDHHRDEAEKALRPIRQMLDGHGIPYSAHTVVGDRAQSITATARRLRCDRILSDAAAVRPEDHVELPQVGRASCRERV